MSIVIKAIFMAIGSSQSPQNQNATHSKRCHVCVCVSFSFRMMRRSIAPSVWQRCETDEKSLETLGPVPRHPAPSSSNAGPSCCECCWWWYTGCHTRNPFQVRGAIDVGLEASKWHSPVWIDELSYRLVSVVPRCVPIPPRSRLHMVYQEAGRWQYWGVRTRNPSRSNHCTPRSKLVSNHVDTACTSRNLVH